MSPDEVAAAVAYEAELDRRYNEALARYRAERDEWQAMQAAVVAELFRMPAEDVTPFLVGACHALHGRPPLTRDRPSTIPESGT